MYSLERPGAILEVIGDRAEYSWEEAQRVCSDDELHFLLGCEYMLSLMDGAVSYAQEELVDPEGIPQLASIVTEIIEKAGEHMAFSLSSDILTAMTVFIDKHPEDPDEWAKYTE